MMIYMAPKMMGEGLPSLQGLRPSSLAQVLTLREMSVDKLGPDIFIQGYPR
jgi:riboflavin biosynthesis pyrimidine reductase